jgi:hypothetical protein
LLAWLKLVWTLWLVVRELPDASLGCFPGGCLYWIRGSYRHFWQYHSPSTPEEARPDVPPVLEDAPLTYQQSAEKHHHVRSEKPWAFLQVLPVLQGVQVVQLEGELGLELDEWKVQSSAMVDPR